MLYRGVRELKVDDAPTGLWHYVCVSGDHTYPIGYCSPWEPCPTCEQLFPDHDCPTCLGRGLVKRDNPCPGHATPEEAQAHYKSYVLDHVTYQEKSSTHWRACEICDEPTRGAASGGGDFYYWILCPKHLNRASVAELLTIGESWEGAE